MPASSFDAIITGAGIGGLCTADALIEKGLTCAIIDTDSPGNGASGAPMMLVNPATGRRAKRAWRAEICYKYTEKLLKSAQQHSSVSVYENNGVIRPALTQKIAKDFRRSISKYNWKPGWVHWLNEDEFSDQFPIFSRQYGGLYIAKGMTVNGKNYMNALSAMLKNSGLRTFYNTDYTETVKNNRFYFETPENTLTSTYHIDATGFNQTKNTKWDFLPLHPVKGQTATFKFNDPVNLRHSVSSLGYMAVMNSKPKQITVGSTYEHKFEHLDPDKSGFKYLKDKLDRNLPGYSDKSISVEQWANVRVSVPDKKPVAGAQPDQKNFCIIAALGSKGLLMGRYIAGMLAEHIVHGTPIDNTLSVNRFTK